VTAAEFIALRKRLHWTQVEAARQLGFSPRSITNWEKERNKIPKSVAIVVTALTARTTR
jgi:DNA-binding XRE family transcriptional regulator